MDWAKYQIDIPSVIHDVCQEEAALPRHYSLGAYDIGCGRGQRFCTHIGNLRFREIVNAHVDLYLKAHNKIAKTALIVSILDEVRRGTADGKNRGRFVKQQEDGSWVELGDAASRDKVSNALRSAVSSRKGGSATDEAALDTSSSSSRNEEMKADSQGDSWGNTNENRRKSTATVPIVPLSREKSSTACAPSTSKLMHYYTNLKSSNQGLESILPRTKECSEPPKQEVVQSLSDISAVIEAFYGAKGKESLTQSNTGLKKHPSTAVAMKKAKSKEQKKKPEGKRSPPNKAKRAIDPNLNSCNTETVLSAASGCATDQQEKEGKGDSMCNSTKPVAGRKKRRDAGKKRKPAVKSNEAPPKKALKTKDNSSKTTKTLATLVPSDSMLIPSNFLPTTPLGTTPLLPMPGNHPHSKLPVVTPRDDGKIQKHCSHQQQLLNTTSSIVGVDTKALAAPLITSPTNPPMDVQEETAMEDLDAVSSLLLLKAGFTGGFKKGRITW